LEGDGAEEEDRWQGGGKRRNRYEGERSQCSSPETPRAGLRTNILLSSRRRPKRRKAAERMRKEKKKRESLRSKLRYLGEG